MGNEIKIILKKQQELEALKNCTFCDVNNGTPPPVSTYGKQILRQCKKQKKKNRLRRFQGILTAVFCIFLFNATLFSLVKVWLYNYAQSKPPLTEDEFNALSSTEKAYWKNNVGQAEIEMAKGNKAEAKRLLEEAMETNPNAFAAFMAYSKFCVKEQDFDKAADVIINNIETHWGVKNIMDGNLLYEQLKSIDGPLSPQTKERYDKCIADCEESIAFYKSLNTLLEDKHYQTVLDLCKFRVQKGADIVLMYNIFEDAYKGLEQYEECAEYLLDLADQIKNDDIYSKHYSFKWQISYSLEEMKPNVCDETAAKIDAACKALEF